MIIEYDKKFDECIFDSTRIAFDIIAKEKVPGYMSRDLFREIFEIASDFLYDSPEDMQYEVRNDICAYIWRITPFGEKRLREYFGLNPEVIYGKPTEVSIQTGTEG